MGNRIGIILHDDWEYFSPLLYSHYAADCRVWQLQKYLREYKVKHEIPNNDGHKYNPSHMLVGYLQSFNPDIHTRVENLSDDQIEEIRENHFYSNCFDGGCWIVNINPYHFGQTHGDYSFKYKNNIVDNDLIEDFE